MEIVFRKKSAILTNVVNEKEIWRVVALGNVAHIDWSSMDVSPMTGGETTRTTTPNRHIT